MKINQSNLKKIQKLENLISIYANVIREKTLFFEDFKHGYYEYRNSQSKIPFVVLESFTRQLGHIKTLLNQIQDLKHKEEAIDAGQFDLEIPKSKNIICQNCENLPAVVFYKADQLNVCIDCQNEITDKHLESWYQKNYKQALLHLTDEFFQQLLAEFEEENFTEISQEKEESHG